jgi:hypothetical protein
MKITLEYMTEIIRDMPYDLRAEVVLAELLEQGIEQDAVLVGSMGLFKRNFSRDIEKVSLMDWNKRRQSALVTLNREGMYDALPQVVTHGTAQKRPPGFKSASDMVLEVSQRRHEQKAARKFFLPFESEFYHQLISLEITERNILKGFLGTSRYTGLMNKFWQLPVILSARQKAVFIYLIPIIHKAVGDLKITGSCYEAMLEVPVSMAYKIRSELMPVETNDNDDAEHILGVNFVCGNKLLISEPYCEISLGPMSAEQHEDYLPWGKGRGIVDFMNGYFFPFDANHALKILGGDEVIEFELCHPHLRLGFTSALPVIN